MPIFESIRNMIAGQTKAREEEEVERKTAMDFVQEMSDTEKIAMLVSLQQTMPQQPEVVEAQPDNTIIHPITPGNPVSPNVPVQEVAQPATMNAATGQVTTMQQPPVATSAQTIVSPNVNMPVGVPNYNDAYYMSLSNDELLKRVESGELLNYIRRTGFQDKRWQDL